MWRASVDQGYKADVKSVRRLVNSNTILVKVLNIVDIVELSLHHGLLFRNTVLEDRLQIVGSAPGFPHGVIDPIEVSKSIYFTRLFYEIGDH